MKKYALSLLAVAVAIITASFTSDNLTSGQSAQKAASGFRWYDFNGTSILDMIDPANYSPDENNFPDCAPSAGYIYCEVYALPSQEDESMPDLTHILNQRMNPL